MLVTAHGAGAAPSSTPRPCLSIQWPPLPPGQASTTHMKSCGGWGGCSRVFLGPTPPQFHLRMHTWKDRRVSCSRLALICHSAHLGARLGGGVPKVTGAARTRGTPAETLSGSGKNLALDHDKSGIQRIPEQEGHPPAREVVPNPTAPRPQALQGLMGLGSPGHEAQPPHLALSKWLSGKS